MTQEVRTTCQGDVLRIFNPIHQLQPALDGDLGIAAERARRKRRPFIAAGYRSWRPMNQATTVTLGRLLSRMERDSAFHSPNDYL